MPILDNFKQKMGETARFAVKKGSDKFEITKLNINIGYEEDKVKKIFCDMGKIMFENYINNEGVSEKYIDYCDAVKKIYSNIDVMKLKIRELKAVIECENCKEELDENMTFCFKCGTKQTKKPQSDVKSVDIEDECCGNKDECCDGKKEDTCEDKKE